MHNLYKVVFIGIFFIAFGGNLPSAHKRVETTEMPTAPSDELNYFTLDLVAAAGQGTLTSSVLRPPSIGCGEIIRCPFVSAGEADTNSFAARAGDKVPGRVRKL